MITHVGMSFQMGFIMKLVELNLRKYGHTYPFIVAVNKGKALDITFDSSSVMDTKVCRIREGMLLVEEAPEPNDTYVEIVMLRLRSDEDEKAISEIYEEVANKYSPDAIGYVQSCLYNEYPDPNTVTRDTMLQDPENIQVINMSYYLNGDPIPRISIMPFINKGMDKDSERAKELFESLGEETPNENKIIIASCGWFTPYYKIEPFMPYPYMG